MKYRLKFEKKAQTVPVSSSSTLDKLKGILTSDLGKRTLGMGLGGAVIGGGALGSVSRGMKPGETEEEHRKRLRNAIVIGGLLGGAGGTGIALASPTLSGPDPIVMPGPKIGDKLLDRHGALPVLGGAGGAIGAMVKNPKNIPSKENISDWLHGSTMSNKTMGGYYGTKSKPILGPLAREFEGITASRAKIPFTKHTTVPYMPAAAKRVGFSLLRGGPARRLVLPTAIGAGIMAILNGAIDRGLVGTGVAVTEH